MLPINVTQADAPFEINPAVLWASVTSWISSHTSLILMSLLTGALIFLCLYGLKRFGLWLCRPGRSTSHWPNVIGRALAGTRSWFMIAVAAFIVGKLAKAPETLTWLIQIGFITCLGLQAAIWVRRFILGIVAHRVAADDPTGSLSSAVGIIRLLVTVGLFLLAAILILSNLGVNVSGLLAGLGIGGIAIGLAAQGIFSDLFAALSILFDKPFRKGDLVRWETTAGEVEYIGLKSTRIRSLTGEEIIISNANLLNKELRNFARLERRRINQQLALECHTPIQECDALAAILQPAIDGCDGCHFVRVGLETFGASSLDFMLVYDIDAVDQADTLARRHTANIAILKALHSRSIAFAYPTQTTYTAAPDGRMVMPYAMPPSTGDIIKRKK